MVEHNELVRELLAENDALRGHLLKIMDGSWTYVHGRCTIDTVLTHWKQAREFCGVPSHNLVREARNERWRTYGRS